MSQKVLHVATISFVRCETNCKTHSYMPGGERSLAVAKIMTTIACRLSHPPCTLLSRTVGDTPMASALPVRDPLILPPLLTFFGRPELTDTAPFPAITADMLAAPLPDAGQALPGQPLMIPGDLILITQAPNGTLAIEITATEARIYADTLPHPEDWQLACGLLRWLGATPYALSDGPEVEGDMDVWTAQINPFRVRRSFYP